MSTKAVFLNSTAPIVEIPHSPAPARSANHHYPYAPIDAGVVIGASMAILSMFVWQLRASWAHQLKLSQLEQESDDKLIEKLVNESLAVKRLLIDSTLKNKDESGRTEE